ncbi:hypothetical protein J2Y74_003205 [Pseudomonas migulae]|nr:hypothetical protein [Pseudomonas migulae]
MSESGPDIFCGGFPTTIVLELLRDRFDADLFRGFQAARIKNSGPNVSLCIQTHCKDAGVQMPLDPDTSGIHGCSQIAWP